MQRVVVVHSLDVGRFDRHEHQHEFQRIHARQVGVTLVGEFAHVLAQRGQVRGQLHVALGAVRRATIALVGGQRHLGIDDNVAPLGQMHDHIRARAPAGVVGQRHLGLVAAAFLQSRRFEHAFEHHLAPSALRLRIALERAREIDRVLADTLVEIFQGGDFGLQRTAILVLLVVNLVHALAEFADLLTQRIEQYTEIGLVLFGQLPALLVEQLARQQIEFLGERALALGCRQRLFLQAC